MRKDSKGNPLPPKMHEKHGRYYYVDKNKWHPLAKDYVAACEQLAARESVTGDWTVLVAQTYAKYEALHEKGKLAEGTIKQYRSIRARIEYGFATIPPEAVTTSDVTQFLDLYENTPNIANRMLTVIKAIFQRAVRQGICKFNPAKAAERFEEGERDRYITDVEYCKIRDNANPQTQLIMDMCYLTGQRISDVLNIQHKDIRKGVVYFQQKKSKKGKAGARIEIQPSPEMDEVIRRAKALHRVRSISPYLFHPKGKTTKYTYAAIKGSFNRARKRAKLEDITLHDIRAKAATDAEREGINPQILLGHQSPSNTNRYLRGRRSHKVSGPNIRKVLDRS